MKNRNVRKERKGYRSNKELNIKTVEVRFIENIFVIIA